MAYLRKKRKQRKVQSGSFGRTALLLYTDESEPAVRQAYLKLQDEDLLLDLRNVRYGACAEMYRMVFYIDPTARNLQGSNESQYTYLPYYKYAQIEDNPLDCEDYYVYCGEKIARYVLSELK